MHIGQVAGNTGPEARAGRAGHQPLTCRDRNGIRVHQNAGLEFSADDADDELMFAFVLSGLGGPGRACQGAISCRPFPCPFPRQGPGGLISTEPTFFEASKTADHDPARGRAGTSGRRRTRAQILHENVC